MKRFLFLQLTLVVMLSISVSALATPVIEVTVDLPDGTKEVQNVTGQLIPLDPLQGIYSIGFPDVGISLTSPSLGGPTGDPNNPGGYEIVLQGLIKQDPVITFLATGTGDFLMTPTIKVFTNVFWSDPIMHNQISSDYSGFVKDNHFGLPLYRGVSITPANGQSHIVETVLEDDSGNQTNAGVNMGHAENNTTLTRISSTSFTDTYNLPVEMIGPIAGPSPQPGGEWVKMTTTVAFTMSPFDFASVTGSVMLEPTADPSSTIPEPSTLLFLGTGVLGLGLVSWIRKKRRS